jgi:hypothetical protein
MEAEELKKHRAEYRKEEVTPDIDACYAMMREKFGWDWDGLINPIDLTTRSKVANIICALFAIHEPGANRPNYEYTKEEFSLIEYATSEIAMLCGR